MLIRPMEKSETPQLVQWLYVHKDVNQVNFDVFRRNQVRIWVAEDENGIVAFFPIQSVYMYDALAPRPNVETERLRAAAHAMEEYLDSLSQEENVSKILVQPNNQSFSNFLQKRLGYSDTHPTLERHFKYQSEYKCV